MKRRRRYMSDYPDTGHTQALARLVEKARERARAEDERLWRELFDENGQPK
jgi:hypothetical protein